VRDLALLEELCDMVRNTSLCGLGQNAPNAVLSTLRYFRNEYDELLVEDDAEPALADAGAKENAS
jgi:bidirectional [NiFe] hydrogenase diaphorase subunit